MKHCLLRVGTLPILALTAAVSLSACGGAGAASAPVPTSPSPTAGPPVTEPPASLPAHLEEVWPPPGALQRLDGLDLVLRVDLVADAVSVNGEALRQQEVIARSTLVVDGLPVPLSGYTDDGGWMVEDATGAEVHRVAPRTHQLFWIVAAEPGVHQATYVFRAVSGMDLEYTWQFELATTALTSPATPSAASEGDARRITLALAGDVMLGRWVNAMVMTNGPLYPWGDLLPVVQTADLFLVNLECVIAASGAPFQPPRVFNFRADPSAVEVLTSGGVDYVTLANNHAMDFQGPALLETIQHLDEYGIAHAGAGANIEEASRFAMLEASGIRVAVVAFADHYLEYAATETSPGTNVIPITVEGPGFARIEQSIAAARGAGADLVVFSIHWGPNMRRVPPLEFRQFARAVIDAGADIFHGHSAHIFQGIEVYRGRPILYDTGDLIDDYDIDPIERNDLQFLFLVTATRRGVEGIELVPVRVYNSQVNLARGAVLDDMCQQMIQLSAAMGTEARREGDRLVIDME